MMLRDLGRATGGKREVKFTFSEAVKKKSCVVVIYAHSPSSVTNQMNLDMKAREKIE